MLEPLSELQDLTNSRNEAHSQTDAEVLRNLLDDTPFPNRNQKPAPRRSIRETETAQTRQVLEGLLAHLVDHAAELLGKSPLYFSRENMEVLGRPTNAIALADLIDNKARGLLLCGDLPDAPRYMNQAAELRAVVIMAERVALLFTLLQNDTQMTSAFALLRRVTDPAGRVLRCAASSLYCADPTQAVLAAKALKETTEACRKAHVLLGRTPAILMPRTERMVRAAVWSIESITRLSAQIAAETVGQSLNLDLTPKDGMLAPLSKLF